MPHFTDMTRPSMPGKCRLSVNDELCDIDLTGATYRAVADARAALAALDSTSRRLPNPRLFRRPALQAEAQSTSALEPTLTVSPWFETRRTAYYDRLFEVSTCGDWDSYVRFFATGLESSARRTHDYMIVLVGVQEAMRDQVRRSKLRAETAQALVDYAVANVSFTVRAVERDLKISYGRANELVSQLVALGLLAPVADGVVPGSRRFFAPQVLDVLVEQQAEHRSTGSTA